MRNSESPDHQRRRSATLDRISDGIVALDEDLRYTFVNDQAERLLDSDRDELLGSPVWEVFLDTEDAEARDSIEHAIETGQPVSFEQYNADLEQWFEVRVYPDDDGVSILFTDISQRKETESELETANHQLNALLGTTDQAIYVKDADGEYQLMNEAAAALFGLDPESGIGKRDEDLFDEESATRIRASDERIMETGEGVVEESIHHIDGQEYVFLDDKSPYVDENGEMAGVIGISRDITRRRQQRRELLRAETLFRNAQDALFLIDIGEDAFRIERVNPAYERLTGLSNDEIRGKTLSEVFGEEDAAAIAERYQTCIERGEPVEYDEKLSIPEPESYWETRIAPVTVDGDAVQIVGATRNVTDRRRHEQKIKAQRDDLELLTQMMSHDIRNDLQIVSAYANMLKEHVDEEGSEYLDLIRDSATTAVELTKSASDLTEAMLGSDDRTRPVSLRAALDTQLSEIRASYESAAVTVDGEIPEVSVLADDMLGSVFRNVLKNAIQHNDKPVPEVTIHVDAGTDAVCVRVADNGPGIPDDRMESIFGRGQKGLDSEGTGIGLYLVRTLVEQYGGDVDVENRDPEGASFTIKLPRAEATQ